MAKGTSVSSLLNARKERETKTAVDKFLSDWGLDGLFDDQPVSQEELGSLFDALAHNTYAGRQGLEVQDLTGANPKKLPSNTEVTRAPETAPMAKPASAGSGATTPAPSNGGNSANRSAEAQALINAIKGTGEQVPYQGNKGVHAAMGGLGAVAKVLAGLSGNKGTMEGVNAADEFMQGQIMNRALNAAQKGQIAPMPAGASRASQQQLLDQTSKLGAENREIGRLKAKMLVDALYKDSELGLKEREVASDEKYKQSYSGYLNKLGQAAGAKDGTASLEAKAKLITALASMQNARAGTADKLRDIGMGVEEDDQRNALTWRILQELQKDMSMPMDGTAIRIPK